MRSAILSIFAFLLIFFQGPVPSVAATLSYEWSDTLNAKKVESLLAQAVRLAQSDSNDYEIRVQGALLAFYAWRLEKQDNGRRLNLAKIGARLSREAVRLRPDGAEGHHWLGATLGMIGLTRGVLNSLQLVPSIKKHLERSIELDPNYLDSNASSTLGRVYTVLPGFPLSIGDKSAAMKHILRARKRSPNFSLTQLFLGDLLWAMDKPNEAVAELKKIETMTPRTEQQYFLFEVNREKAKHVIELIQSGTERDPFYDVLSDIQPGIVN